MGGELVGLAVEEGGGARLAYWEEDQIYEYR